jgi:hypothetical protein
MQDRDQPVHAACVGHPGCKHPRPLGHRLVDRADHRLRAAPGPRTGADERRRHRRTHRPARPQSELAVGVGHQQRRSLQRLQPGAALGERPHPCDVRGVGAGGRCGPVPVRGGTGGRGFGVVRRGRGQVGLRITLESQPRTGTTTPVHGRSGPCGHRSSGRVEPTATTPRLTDGVTHRATTSGRSALCPGDASRPCGVGPPPNDPGPIDKSECLLPTEDRSGVAQCGRHRVMRPPSHRRDGRRWSMRHEPAHRPTGSRRCRPEARP